MDKQQDKNKKEPLEKEDYGFYFYPDRKIGEGNFKKESILDIAKKGIHGYANSRCIHNAYTCVRTYPTVKLMMRAMKAHGCPVDFQRHISCEPCKHGVSGGFDETSNQVVLCERAARNKNVACSTLTHELLHAFDKCRAKLDFKDPRHVACTEIRAANLFHCTLSGSIMLGETSPFKYKMAHQACVKHRALQSLLLVRSLTEEEGMKIIDEVFVRCYNDLEPLGRRMRPGTGDPDRALLEGLMYGYSET